MWHSFPLIFPTILAVLAENSLLQNSFTNLHKGKHLSQCIENVFERVRTRNDQIIWIFHPTQPSTFNDEIFRKIAQESPSLIVHNSQFEQLKTFWTQIDIYFIQTAHFLHLESILSQLIYTPSWNSRGKFIILLENSSKAAISDTIPALWFEGVYNFLILTETGSYSLDLHTWYPYNHLSFSEYATINSCKNGALSRSTSSLFPRKIPRKLDSLPLLVGAIVFPPYVMDPTDRIGDNFYNIQEGLEVTLVRTIGKELNMSVVFYLSEKLLNWGRIDANGSAYGLMATLQRRDVDIAIGSLSGSSVRQKFFELSHSYSFESYSWCVPHARTLPSWKRLVDVIDRKIWFAYFVLFSSFSAVFWLLSRYSSTETIYKKYLNCLQTLVSVAIGVSARHPRSAGVRLVFLFWALFSYNFDTLYESQVISGLTKPIYRKQIKSVEGILEHDLRIQFIPNVFGFFNYNVSDSVEEVLEKSVVCKDVTECFERVAYEKDSALCVSTAYMHYVKNRYVSESNLPMVYCFRGNVVSYPVLIIMRKGFPLRDRFNELILRLSSGGFLQHWEQNIFAKRWTKIKLWQMHNGPKKSIFLNLHKMKTAFFCWLFGLGVSGMCFVGEWVCFVLAFSKEKCYEKMLQKNYTT